MTIEQVSNDALDRIYTSIQDNVDGAEYEMSKRIKRFDLFYKISKNTYELPVNYFMRGTQEGVEVMIMSLSGVIKCAVKEVGVSSIKLFVQVTSRVAQNIILFKELLQDIELSLSMCLPMTVSYHIVIISPGNYAQFLFAEYPYTLEQHGITFHIFPGDTIFYRGN